MSVLSNLTFGRIQPGLIKLGLNGQMAVNIGGSYKYYDEKKNRLINTDNFVFPMEVTEFFFIMPTNKVKKGDIILVNGKPVYVLKPETDGKIEILSYEDSSIKQILPERHTFLGGTYMYSKIVSMFGNKSFDKNTIMKYMMMNTMFGKDGFGGSMNGMNPMMLMMMSGGSNPFTDMFNFDTEDGTLDGLFGGNTEEEAETKEE